MVIQTCKDERVLVSTHVFAIQLTSLNGSENSLFEASGNNFSRFCGYDVVGPASRTLRVFQFVIDMPIATFESGGNPVRTQIPIRLASVTGSDFFGFSFVNHNDRLNIEILLVRLTSV